MKRTGFKRPTFAEVSEKRKSKAVQEKPARGRATLGAGRRTREWNRVWQWLKPRLEARGRTHCEFDHLPHQCSGILTPAHSRKRRKMEGDEIYEVAIACTNAHQILDERLNHEQMYVCVNYAIERAGGLITPEPRTERAHDHPKEGRL
jgi:hypothetical protein